MSSALTGKKLNLSDKNDFQLSQRQINKSINGDGTVNERPLAKFSKKADGGGFHPGGFVAVVPVSENFFSVKPGLFCLFYFESHDSISCFASSWDIVRPFSISSNPASMAASSSGVSLTVPGLSFVHSNKRYTSAKTASSSINAILSINRRFNSTVDMMYVLPNVSKKRLWGKFYSTTIQVIKNPLLSKRVCIMGHKACNLSTCKLPA